MVNELELSNAHETRKSVNHSLPSLAYGIMQIDGKPTTSVHFAPGEHKENSWLK